MEINLNCDLGEKSIHYDGKNDNSLLEIINSANIACVYHAGNNVVERQVVNMEFDSGPLVTLIMHGHAAEGGRSMRYDGTKGTLIGKFGPNPYIEITNHKTGEIKRIEIDEKYMEVHGMSGNQTLS